MEIHFVTGNQGKFDEVKLILKDWTLVRSDIDLEEIQGTPEEIVTTKAKTAYSLLNKPLVVEDVSFCCSALGGFPGPYIKDFLRALGDGGISEVIHTLGDRRASVHSRICFMEAPDTFHIFEGSLQGTIVPPKGETKIGKYSWNSIFQPDGQELTMGEMTMKQHSEVSHRRQAFSKLAEYLKLSQATK